MKRNIVKITHFISFDGRHLEATAENYAIDAARYFPVMRLNMHKSEINDCPREQNAYARQAGIYAASAAHCAIRALELGYKVAEVSK